MHCDSRTLEGPFARASCARASPARGRHAA